MVTAHLDERKSEMAAAERLSLNNNRLMVDPEIIDIRLYVDPAT